MDRVISPVAAGSVATALLVSAPHLRNVIGTRGARALERLMGMALVIFATQMLLDGVRAFVRDI